MTIRNSLTVLSILVLSGCNLFDSSVDYNLSLIPFQEKEDGDWGFINLKGEVIIKPDYENRPSIFRNGYSLVKTRKGFYDYINTDGKLMEQELKNASIFNEGLACVVEENQPISYLNTDMKIVFTLDKEIELAGLFSQGLAKVKKSDGKWGFIDKTGKVVIDAKYDYVESFSEELALVMKYNDENIKQYGFINKRGEVIIKIDDKYEILSSFSEGLAAYSDGDGWGFINKTGEKIIKANDEWENVTAFCNGYSSFKEDNEWGLVDKEGNQIIRNKYKYPLKFYNDLALIIDNDKIGFINLERDEVIEPEFDEIGLPFLTNTAIVKDGSDYIFIGKDGKPANKNEVYNISSEVINNLYINNDVINVEQTIESDYFDIDQVVNHVITNLSLTNFNGIEVSSTLEQVMEKMGISEENLPNNSYSKYILLDLVKINNNSSYRFKLYFDDNVSQSIIKKVKEQYGYYTYTRDKIIGFKPNEKAVFSGIECTIDLNNKGNNKGEAVAKAIKDKFESNNLNFLKEESSKDKFVFGEDSANKYAVIEFSNSKVEFYVEIKLPEEKE